MFEPVVFYVTRRARGDLLDFDDSRLIELLGFLKGRRLFSVFGTWRSRPKRLSNVQMHHEWEKARHRGSARSPTR